MHAFSPEFACVTFCVSFDPESYGRTACPSSQEDGVEGERRAWHTRHTRQVGTSSVRHTDDVP